MSGADRSEIERLDEAGCRWTSVIFDQLVPHQGRRARLSGKAMDISIRCCCVGNDASVVAHRSRAALGPLLIFRISLE